MFDKIFKNWFSTEKKDSNKTTKIVVIDDAEDNRVFFKKVLEKRGYTVLTATSGEEGLPIVKDQKPSIVLLDFMMPGMKGPDVCRAIKSNEQTKNIPVLFLTSVDTPADIINCYEEGAENFLMKPIQAGELV